MHNRFGLPPENKITHPYPAIVIAVGDSAVRITCQVEHIYLRGDARRVASSSFFQIMQDETGSLALAELGVNEVASPEPTTAVDFLETRQAALQSAIEQAAALKTQMELALHEQRIHDRLILAGWGEKYDIPLNIFIIGNINDPWVSGLLLPLGAIMNDIQETIGLCQAHWLLDIAVFPESSPDQDLAVWSFMQALDDFLQPESEPRIKLAEALQLQSSQAPDFSIFLFDYRKEGTALVKDPASLERLLGNALLALLQENLAGEFFGKRDMDAIYARDSYYGSIGASTLVYDPDGLQMACAGHSGYTFVKEKILCPARDGQAAIQLAGQIQEKLGGIYAWLEMMCSPLPPPVGMLRIQADLSEMVAMFTDLSVPELDYEKVNQTPWSEKLQEYDANFQKVTLPEVETQLVSNQETLKTFLNEILKTSFDRLPLETVLFPGGLQNSLSVLDYLTEEFKRINVDLKNLLARLPEDMSTASAKFASQSEAMAKLLSAAPNLPWGVRILPSFVRKWLAPLVMTWSYGHKIYLATQLKEECILLLQRMCGLRVAQQAVSLLMKTPAQLQAQVKKTKTALGIFEDKLDQAMETFPSDWGTFPQAPEQNGWDELFRRPVADQVLTEWIYKNWLPDFDTWVQDFLAAKPLFDDWRSAEVKDIAAWIEEKASMTYQPVWNLSLDAIFALWAKETDGFPPEKFLSLETIKESMLAAIPPVRPNFDAVGGSNGAGMTFLGIFGDPEWKDCCLPPAQGGATRWRANFTGDPFLAMFLQVFHNIPLNSLVDSFEGTRRRLEALPDDKRRAYDLLAGLNEGRRSMLETVDPDSPDYVHKTFQWKFQPKGSSKEIDQKIELAISRSRFEYFRRQPRLNGQWNVYAELEMAEVRDLASEFQRLHASHKWSTFNQAYNVLKFVQSCVHYSSDKDTTGHKDWARYPIETLMEGTGDCEDVAILCGALIARLGFQVVLLLFPPVAKFNTHHLGFGIAGAEKLKGDYIVDPKTGRYYFYGESTANGWHLGQIPEHYRGTIPEQILPVEILTDDEGDE